MSGNVHQDDEDKLKATVKQKEKDRVISGDLDSSNPETDDSSIPTGEVREAPIALLYGYDADVNFVWQRLRTDGSWRLQTHPYQGTAANLKCEPVQGTAASLKATVTQAAKDRTISNVVDVAAVNPETDDDNVPASEVRETLIAFLYAYDDTLGAWKRAEMDPTTGALLVHASQTSIARTVTGTATVTPSGDMARKEYYDRNAIVKLQYYSASPAPHSSTTRFTYTVPTDKKYYNSCVYASATIDVATSGKRTIISHVIDPYGDPPYGVISQIQHHYGGGPFTALAITAIFYLLEGDVLDARTINDDSIAHGINISTTGLEFDE